MKYIVMHDYKRCEIYIIAVAEEDVTEFAKRYKDLDTQRIHCIADTAEYARIEACRDAKDNLWRYNPNRNGKMRR